MSVVGITLTTMTDFCIHDFAPGQCGYCKETPFGLTDVVFKSRYGTAFHIWKECEYLESGQKFAESKGGTASEITPILLTEATEKLYPCEWCCALYYTKGEDLEDCLITKPEGTRPAKIVKHRYLGRNMREYQIYYPETGEIEISTNRYVRKFT
jgi:hypothetical protein